MDRLIKEVGLAVSERVHGGAGSVDDVARELQEKLMLRGEATKQLTFESIHVSHRLSLDSLPRSRLFTTARDGRDSTQCGDIRQRREPRCRQATTQEGTLRLSAAHP